MAPASAKSNASHSTPDRISIAINPATASSLVPASPSPDPPPEGERPPRTILVGETPYPAHVPSGCRFHPRCPLAFDRCRVEEPPLFDVGDGHRAACWLAEAGPLDLPVIDAVEATGGSEAAAVEVGVATDGSDGPAAAAAAPDAPAS